MPQNSPTSPAFNAPSPGLAAVVVHFGDPLLTETAVRMLLDCQNLARIVVVLHDLYPLDRTPRADWIESENRGYAAGLNVAIQSLLPVGRAQHVLAMNPDVRITCGDVIKLFDQHLKTGAAATFPVLREKGKLLHGYRFSSMGTLLNVERNADWHSGACFLFSIEAWKTVNGFDEAYFHYFEDYDFCSRLKKAGFTHHLALDVVVEHATKSGADYPGTELPKYSVRNHLFALDHAERLGPLTFLNVIARQFCYLFRWKKGWRAIPQWLRGINEFFALR